ncbi:MAG: four helix bundle protein [Nanoarchaeota archaeon]
MLSIINAAYESYKILVAINEKVSKRWRYSFGFSAEEHITSFLRNLIMAKNAPKALKAKYLIEAESYLELLRLQLRMYLELELANETKIFQLQAKLEETGRMLGGWLKSLQ